MGNPFFWGVFHHFSGATKKKLETQLVPLNNGVLDEKSGRREATARTLSSLDVALQKLWCRNDPSAEKSFVNFLGVFRGKTQLDFQPKGESLKIRCPIAVKVVL